MGTLKGVADLCKEHGISLDPPTPGRSVVPRPPTIMSLAYVPDFYKNVDQVWADTLELGGTSAES